MLHGPEPTQMRARKLRREMTLPEVLLWQILRKRPAGLRFRRQHPAGTFVLDFFCPSHRLAVEIDGEAHNRGDRPDRNAERNAWLAAMGVNVLRIAAADVLKDPEAVVALIITTAGRTASYPSTACGGPPPLAGEDQ